jgi:DNA-binding transcriptional ArsR family regulator
MSDRPDASSRYEVTDVSALRALTHPLRARILGALRLEGSATASQLGRRLGESSGATSYHLRQLARFGFVEEAPEQVSRRERVWRATHALTSIDPRRFSGGADAVVFDEFSRRQLAQLQEQSQRWLSHRSGESPEWASAAGFSDAMARLSPAACAELHERLTALVDELQARSAGEPDTAWVSVFLAALPVSDEEALG